MKSDVEYLRLAARIAQDSRASGNHPFGALLVGPEGDVLITSGNTHAVDRGVGHAETNVARAAAQQYDQAFLERCTLVTSVEPCCMCAGACYWPGIGTVVYGLSECTAPGSLDSRLHYAAHGRFWSSHLWRAAAGLR